MRGEGKNIHIKDGITTLEQLLSALICCIILTGLCNVLGKAAKDTENIINNSDELSTVSDIESFLSVKCENSLKLKLICNGWVNGTPIDNILLLTYKSSEGNLTNIFYHKNSAIYRLIIKNECTDKKYSGIPEQTALYDSKDDFDFLCENNKIYLTFKCCEKSCRYLLGNESDT